MVGKMELEKTSTDHEDRRQHLSLNCPKSLNFALFCCIVNIGGSDGYAWTYPTYLEMYTQQCTHNIVHNSNYVPLIVER